MIGIRSCGRAARYAGLGLESQPESPPEEEGHTPNPASVTWLGDYSTGNLLQWPWMQAGNGAYDGAPSGYPGGYNMAVVPDPGVRSGYAARVEVRDGDEVLGGERSEMSGATISGGSNGQTIWYEFWNKLPSGWSNHGNWGLTNQFHSASGVPLAFGWTNWFGHNADWILRINNDAMIWHHPYPALDVWYRTTLQIKWSTSSDGFIRLWLNDVRQTFEGGGDTWNGVTLYGGSNCYYKEGIYRDAGSSTATRVIYHSGFRACSAADGLTWIPT